VGLLADGSDGSPAHPYLSVQSGLACSQYRYRTTSHTQRATLFSNVISLKNTDSSFPPTGAIVDIDVICEVHVHGITPVGSQAAFAPNFAVTLAFLLALSMFML
jgi:hypothetical protein